MDFGIVRPASGNCFPAFAGGMAAHEMRLGLAC